LFTDEALLLFPADYWRYYLIRILPERKDSNFEWKDFQDKINNELIANYGNLFYRVTNFIEKRYKTIPEPGELGEKEKNLDAIYKKTLEKIKEHTENVRLREALKEIMYLSGETNRYFQEKQPWASKDANTTLYFSVNLLRTLTNLLHPFIPGIAEQGLKCLNTGKENWADIYDFKLKPGHEVKSKILIDKIEPMTKRQGVIDVNKISFDEFQKMDLRVGTIQKVENHPDADKLYVLEIDTGEKKQIIAGIKEFYGKEDLEGKQVIVVNNLEPAKLRGKESQGMMLAAEDEDGNVSLLTTDKKMKNGSKIR
jgi:methionyl-tRNA synthetase